VLEDLARDDHVDAFGPQRDLVGALHHDVDVPPLVDVDTDVVDVVLGEDVAVGVALTVQDAGAEVDHPITSARDR
jgi:hypothetical protein